MTYSLATANARPTVDESSAAAATSSTPQAMTAVAAISDAPAAANEDAAATADYFASPLWVIAFGMAVFFAIVVVLIASGG